MPKKTTKREIKRPAPYDLRASHPTSTIAPGATMATALASPVAPWTPHHSQQLSWSDPNMGVSYQPHHMTNGSHPAMANFTMPLQPTTLSQHSHPHLYQHQQQHQPQPPPQHQHQPQHPSQPHPGQSAPWTLLEDNILMDAKGSGLGWNEIHQKHFPNKSGNACRKRHERLMVKLRTTDWNDQRIRQVMNEYNAPGVRQEFWTGIARRLNERWEDVERVCFQQGLKGLRTPSNGSGHHAPSHSRGRSRASSGLGPVSEYGQASSHDEYEQQKYVEQDDSGIDLGAPGPSRRTSMSHQVAMGGSGTIPGIEHIMGQSGGGYEYQV